MVETLEIVDILCVVIYFVAVLVVGLWSTFRPNRGNSDATGYFLAGKSMNWFLVGSSIFATNVGGPMFIGLAGTAAASGFAVAIYEWHAIFILIALGWVFVPVYIASGAFTMPEYLKRRFGGVRLRIFISVAHLVKYILSGISGQIYSGAIFMNQLLGVNTYLSIAIILIVTAIYTVAGVLDMGSWYTFLESYSRAASNQTLLYPQNFSCGLPRDDFQHIFRDPVNGDIPWTGSVFGLTVIGLCVWCTDQAMVQRSLAAKNMSHAKGGALLAAGLKISPFFLFIIPGMISRIYFPDEVACADPVTCKSVCGNEAGCSNIAYPLLVLRKMPTGLKGLMLSALMAALMSSLTSVFNSASSIVTMDLWRRFRRNAKQSELMIVGRLCVVVLIGFSIIWIPIVEKSQGGQLWNYLAVIASCLCPPWCCVFLLALFWQGTTEKGAFWGLVISNGAGFIRIILEFTYIAPFCGRGEEDTRPDILKKVNFLHYAIISTGVSVISTVAISLFTERRSPEKLRRVTWWTRHDPRPPEDSDSEDDIGLDENNINTVTLQPPQKKTVNRRIYNWLCGQDNKPKPKLSAEEIESIKRKMTDISENKTSAKITSAVAVLLSLVGAFLFGFFA